MKQPPRSQRGQALVEYVVAASLVLLLLTVPTGGESSALEFTLKSIHTAWEKFLAALSLPQ